MPEPAEDRQDRLRLVVAVLCGLVALTATCGTAALAAYGREPSAGLAAIAGAAIGALTGVIPSISSRVRNGPHSP